MLRENTFLLSRAKPTEILSSVRRIFLLVSLTHFLVRGVDIFDVKYNFKSTFIENMGLDWLTIIDRNIGEKELILTCHLQEQEAVSGGQIGGASSGDYSGGQWRPPVYELYCH